MTVIRYGCVVRYVLLYSLACLSLFSVYSTVYANTPDWLDNKPGLEKKVGDEWEKVDWRKNKKALDKILEECICKFVVPFTLPKGTTIVPGKDDMELTKERTSKGGKLTKGPNGETPPPNTMVPHDGVDIGSRISKDGGKTLGKLGKAKVKPMYPNGYIRNNHGLEQKIKCEKDGYRLIIVLDYGHVDPDPGIGGDWKPTPKSGDIGKLEGEDEWNSLDPDLTKKMKDKGNHIHLAIEGIYDLTYEMILAHNKQLAEKPVSEDEADFLKRRAHLYNTILAKTTGTYKKPKKSEEEGGEKHE